MLKPQKRLTKRELKQDKLVTVWFQASDYVSQHSRELLLGAVAVAVVIAGVIWYNHYQKSQENLASVLLAHGKTSYEKQQTQAAIDTLLKLVNNYDGTPSAAVGTVYLANAFLQKKAYADAEKYFRQYLDDYGDDAILRIIAAAGIAATYDERGDFAKAGELYEKAARDHRDSYRAPELYMKAARCYYLGQKSTEAARVLALLLKEYPEAKQVEEARLLQAELRS
ncbi:MAG: tetratricopeptide repeat protein [candidate division KSB1 bacterium]|nr:tetratricopeptide repeat protein [candidate division KSB1 bacterium]MDZ7275486.1 tetratricopeptide repeat protein [candidate division KSB1 bacterium]MDZ7286202.1 tetratricopeptide repeat protein [candidate division KSB1 bacterium]MDZ7296428.1 tetratricopeptide repeat protein [candidate division KSB1 bacterium]MDZ7309273.1 tetratricopeptide repeat protein [candidate division KSB1 bacterium]